MKFTVRLYVYWVTIFFTFYVGVLVVARLLLDVDFVLWQVLLIFFIVGMIPPAIITFLFAKRLNYMESDELEPPSFKGQQEAVLKYEGYSKCPFDDVLQRVDRQWIISYSDRENGVLKFRTDSRMMSWGLGGYVKMDVENCADNGEDEKSRDVQVIVYPIDNRSQRELELVTQTMDIMATILQTRRGNLRNI